MRGLIIFMIAILFSSCSGGGDDIEPYLRLNKSELVLTAGERDTLAVESSGIKSLQWITDNDYSIAIDEKGIVSAIRIGEAVVTVNDLANELTSECSITINPKYNIYIEPPLLFGSTIEEFKKEMEKLNVYSLKFSTDNFLNYTIGVDNIISMMICNFSVNGLSTIKVNLKYTEHVLDFLSERYKLENKVGAIPDPITYSFINKDGDMSVTYVEEPAKVGSTITYAPANNKD